MTLSNNLGWLGIGSITVGALAISWFLVGWLVRHAESIGLIDRPNERSSHTRVTPRGGGAAIVIVWLVGLVVAAPKFFPADILPIFIVAGSAVAVAVVSLCDDFRSLSASVRLAVHTVAALIAVWTVSGIAPEPVPMLLSAAAVVWIVGLTNIFNFMDGIDGLAGLQAVVTAMACLVAGIWLRHEGIVVSSALMVGGAAGFLMHNWSPARIFMGDVGSAFCGFVFAVMIFALIAARVPNGGGDYVRPLLAGLLLVGPFVGDGVFTLLERLRRGEAIWKPHRSHLYQRLVLAGWSHARTAQYYCAWAVTTAGAALGISRGANLLWAGVEVAFLVFTWGLVQHVERRQRRGVQGRR